MKKALKILGLVWLTVTIWAVFDIWVHDYGLGPYYDKYEMIKSARNAYLYGFWTFAVLNILVITIATRAWRFFISLVVMMLSGAEDFMYYVLQPILNPARANRRADFIPNQLEWLNDNLWLKFLSGGEIVSERGLYLGLGIGFIVVLVFLYYSCLVRKRRNSSLRSE